MSNKKVIIIGAGGHSKVIADIVKKSDDEIIGFLDDIIKIGTIIIENYKVIGKLNDILKFKSNEDVEFIIAIGDNRKRKEIAEIQNIKIYTAIHPSAQIGMNIKIGEGTVIMANACINSAATIGKHCIINTGAIIEHDNKIEDYVHISPNATLGGTVNVGECTHIGIGAIVKNNISICKNAIIGAGAVVLKDITEEGTYIGVPVRKI